MPPFDTSRRLCLLVQAGEVRCAIEASAVTEVATPDPSGDTLHGHLELVDLSLLLGGRAEERPGYAVVLDVSPTLTVRVRSVQGAMEVSGAPYFSVPPTMSAGLSTLTRGALLYDDRLHLELSPDALPHTPTRLPTEPVRTVCALEQMPESSLVFESGGRLFGLPLSLVTQVVTLGPAFCPSPAPSASFLGLVPQGQVLWPVHSAPALLGGTGTVESMLVLTELAGHGIAFTASRVLDVVSGRRAEPDTLLEATRNPGEMSSARLPGPVLFLDWQRMFS